MQKQSNTRLRLTGLRSATPLLLVSADILLCPLYWQLDWVAPTVLLAMGQCLIACGAINSWRMREVSDATAKASLQTTKGRMRRNRPTREWRIRSWNDQ
jgi:hypothetical protein